MLFVSLCYFTITIPKNNSKRTPFQRYMLGHVVLSCLQRTLHLVMWHQYNPQWPHFTSAHVQPPGLRLKAFYSTNGVILQQVKGKNTEKDKMNVKQQRLLQYAQQKPNYYAFITSSEKKKSQLLAFYTFNILILLPRWSVAFSRGEFLQCSRTILD